MNDNDNGNEKVVGWWASSSDEDHEQISLYEVVRGGESFLDSFTVTLADHPTLDDFIQEVKRNFGGGVYVAAVRGANGTFAKRPRFAISGRPIREKLEEAAPAAQPENSFDRLAGLLLQQQQASDDRMMKILEKMTPAAAPADPLEMFERAANILSKNGAAPVVQKSLPEQLAELHAVQEFFESMGGGKDGGNGMELALTELVGGIREVMSESEKTRRMQIAARVRNSGQPAAPAITSASEKEPVQVSGGMMGLLKLLEQLVEAAEGKEDVQDIARQVWASASKDETASANLKGLLEREDALEVLARANPKVSQHFDWFENLANAVLDLMEGGGNGGTDGNDDADAPDKKPASNAALPPVKDSGRGRRNPANAAADAGTGAKRQEKTPRKVSSARAGQ